MKNRIHILFGLVALSGLATVLGQQKSSYAPVVPKEEFSATMSRMKTERTTALGSSANPGNT